MKHLSEIDLALVASDDTGRIRRFSLERHVRRCPECQEKVDEFRSLRTDLANYAPELPDLSHSLNHGVNAGSPWSGLAAEMRANIRLGLEAGECVRETRGIGSRFFGGWSLGLSAAFACLLLLAGASFFMRDVRPFPAHPAPLPGISSAEVMPSLESTTTGVELRSGSKSFTLLNHEGTVANQTVSTQGAVRSRYVDAGAVTISEVYLE
jgi:hypothetical protein